MQKLLAVRGEYLDGLQSALHELQETINARQYIRALVVLANVQWHLRRIKGDLMLLTKAERQAQSRPPRS
jgi:hypothetical protein